MYNPYYDSSVQGWTDPSYNSTSYESQPPLPYSSTQFPPYVAPPVPPPPPPPPPTSRPPPPPTGLPYVPPPPHVEFVAPPPSITAPPPPPPADADAEQYDPEGAIEAAGASSIENNDKIEVSGYRADDIKKTDTVSGIDNRQIVQRAATPAAPARALGTMGVRDAFRDDSSDDEGEKAKQMKAKTSGSSIPSSGTVAVDIDPAVLSLVAKTAAWACNNPQKFEILLQNSRNNENLFFLYDKESPAGIKFIEELSRLRACLEVQKVTGSALVEPPPPPPVLSSQQLPSSSDSIQNAIMLARQKAAVMSSSAADPSSYSADGARRAKRNRWGAPLSETSPAPAAAYTTAPAAPASRGVNIKDTESTASMWNDSAEYSAKFEAQLREQKELQLLESRVREAAARQMRSEQREELRQQIMAGAGSDELQAERIRQYEALAKLDDPNFRDTVMDAELNGGVIEGGTWEHRKRAKEMLATAQKNFEMTTMASGKHHMADFLPQDELNKFLKKSTAVLQGQPVPKEEDYAEHKIGDDNIGFQMLKKVGWSQGTCLGPVESSSSSSSSSARGAAITAPINATAAPAGVTGAGLGAAASATHEVVEGDSEFDAYRKRMMLAYRFRPNPLNNPRRNYY